MAEHNRELEARFMRVMMAYHSWQRHRQAGILSQDEAPGLFENYARLTEDIKDFHKVSIPVANVSITEFFKPAYGDLNKWLKRKFLKGEYFVFRYRAQAVGVPDMVIYDAYFSDIETAMWFKIHFG